MKAANDDVAVLNVPDTVPADFVEHLRARALPGRARALVFNSVLDAVPPELWSVCDKATEKNEHRLFAFNDMFSMLVCARGLLPACTLKDNSEAQRDIVVKAKKLRDACRHDGFVRSIDLKDLIALAAVSEKTSSGYRADAAETLLRLGNANNSDVTLTDLLQGLVEILEKSAGQLEAVNEGNEPHLFASKGNRQPFDETGVRQVEDGFGRALGRLPSYEIVSDDDSGIYIKRRLPDGLIPQQVQTTSATIDHHGISYTLPLYGYDEPIHDNDFPEKSPGRANHLYVATGLIRWFRSYTDKPYTRLVRQTVEALLGSPPDRGKKQKGPDYTVQADRNARRLNENQLLQKKIAGKRYRT